MLVRESKGLPYVAMYVKNYLIPFSYLFCNDGGIFESTLWVVIIVAWSCNEILQDFCRVRKMWKCNLRMLISYSFS